MKSTNVIVRRVSRLVIETGTVTGTYPLIRRFTWQNPTIQHTWTTAAIAIINLVLSVLPSKPAYYQIPSVILAKVYSNSMMAVLNSRMITSGRDHTGEIANSAIPPLAFHATGPSVVPNEGDTFELRNVMMHTAPYDEEYGRKWCCVVLVGV